LLKQPLQNIRATEICALRKVVRTHDSGDIEYRISDIRYPVSDAHALSLLCFINMATKIITIKLYLKKIPSNNYIYFPNDIKYNNIKMIIILKTGYSPCCACAILFVLVDYYLSFPWFPIRLRNIRAILYLLIQGVGIHSFEEIFNDLWLLWSEIRLITNHWNNMRRRKEYCANKDAFKVCLFSPSPCRTYTGNICLYIRLFRSPESRLDL
jgi:hypothetical protein